MVLLYILYLIISLILLWKGSDWLVESSVRIAGRLGVSQLVIGITIVAFGTSAPEFAVTIGAAIKGQADISISNVIGSNIFNLGFILGGVAMIEVIKSTSKLIWRDGMILIATAAVLLIFLWNLQLSRIEGLILIAGLISYNVLLFFEKREVDVTKLQKDTKMRDGLTFMGSIGLIVLGGQLLRMGGVGIARVIGLSEWVIGATVIAAGTSAPEFATSLVAALKGHHGISAGNLIGSCIYNILGVLGLAGLLRQMRISTDARSSLLMMLILIVLAVFLLMTGKRLNRMEGAVLFSIGLLIWIVQFV